jgi:hypothetical protein
MRERRKQESLQNVNSKPSVSSLADKDKDKDKDKEERTNKTPLGIKSVGLTSDEDQTETGDDSTVVALKPKKPKASRRSRKVPADFQFTVEMREWALEHDIGPELARAEWPKFKDYEFAQPKSDWPAVWRNWMRKAKEREYEQNQKGRGTGDTRHDAAEARRQRLRVRAGLPPTPSG